MNPGLLLGALLGAAICLLVLTLVPPRLALTTQVTRWERHRDAVQPTADEPLTNTWSERWGRLLVTQAARRGFGFSKVRTDLELVGASLEGHLVRKCSYGLLGIAVPSLLVLALAAAGVSLPFALPLVASLGMGALFFWIPDLSAAQAADRRRHDLRRALSCYLDLVSMSLAGGRGVPEALPLAARIGRGWAFDLLRTTVDRARLLGDTPWEALAELGERTGTQELQDLGGALTLVANDGAKVRQSLTARAASQRRRQLTEAEGAAAKADQSMEMAQIVLFVGFLLFLGFPAAVAVMAV